jgi:hypothetical protein
VQARVLSTLLNELDGVEMSAGVLLLVPLHPSHHWRLRIPLLHWLLVSFYRRPQTGSICSTRRSYDQVALTKSCRYGANVRQRPWIVPCDCGR